MFDRKPPQETPPEDPSVEVESMPAEFYAGNNPVVKFKTVEKEVDLRPKITPVEKKLLDKETVPGAHAPLHPANLFLNKKFLIWGGVAVFAIIVGGGSAYFLWIDKLLHPPKTPPIVRTTPTTTIDTTSTVPIVDVTPPTSTVPDITSGKGPTINFPSVLLGDSVDSDNDGLTDTEEDLLGTDPGVADTDNDKYPDGHEVYYLYNPAGKEPIRLISSNLVKEFVNPNFNYKIYVPTKWAIGNVDDDYRDVLFSTVTGEYIEVRTFDKTASQSFESWFSEYAPQEKIDNLVEFTTYYKQTGWRRGDYLVYYFVTTDKVYVLVYHTTDSSIVNFRTIGKVMARSFRFEEGSTITGPVSTPTTTPSTTTPSITEIPTTTPSSTVPGLNSSSTPREVTSTASST